MTTPTSSGSRHLGPAERYGQRRRWTRPAVVAGAVLLAVVATAWVVWAGLHHADPAVSARLQGFDVTSSNEVEVTIAIERAAGTPVTCVITAQARDHSLVGEREVVVPAGSGTSLTRTYVVKTEREATNGVLEGCRPAEPAASRQ